MDRLERQSFLGPNSTQVLHNMTVGLIGLGGGGSHEVQQMAHLGIGGYVLVDPDTIDWTNTNRLVGGTLGDVECKRSKVYIAERIIRGLQPDARIKVVQGRWETVLEELKGCDIILGAVDSYVARDQIERFCRRFLIPYIDIGMDVLALGDDYEYLISGQVILSSPGHPCLWCCGFLDEEKLSKEAAQYGGAGGRPQVVWPNGVLASTAVGLLVQLVCPWHSEAMDFTYLVYDGNRGTVTPSPWVVALQSQTCPHFSASEVGDPGFDVRTLQAKKTAKELSSSTQLPPQITARPAWWQRMLSFGSK
jgi:molybdopterin-synthase adenylyltransferase